MVVHYSRRLSPCQEQNQEFVCLISSSDGALLPGWTWVADSLRRFLPNHNRVLFNPSAILRSQPAGTFRCPRSAICVSRPKLEFLNFTGECDWRVCPCA